MGSFALLMWKNAKLHQRRPKGTFVQIMLPVAFVGILWLVRNLTAPNKEVMCERNATGELINDDTSYDCEFEAFALNGDVASAYFGDCSSGDTWTVAYSPTTNAEVDAVMTAAVDLPFMGDTLSADGVTPSAYATEDDMVAALNGGDPSRCRVGVAFTAWPGDSSGSTDFAYKLRFDAIPGGYDSSQSGTSYSRKTWETTKAFPTFLGQGPRGSSSAPGSGCTYPPPPDGWSNITEAAMYCAAAQNTTAQLACAQCASGIFSMTLGTDTPGYMQHEYIAWESLINRAIGRHLLEGEDVIWARAEAAMEGLQLQRFPYPRYTRDGFLYAIQFGLPLLLMLSYMYSALTITRNVVHEKERRLKESMKMMGLPGWAHWLAWFATSFLMLAISNALMAIEVHVGKILPNSDASLFFVYLLAFSTATVMFSFLLSTLFQKASTAAVLAAIVWYFSYLPYQAFISRNYASIAATEKLQFCFLSTTCMSIGAAVISEQEGNGIGVTWKNWTEPVSSSDDFTFAAVIFMLFFDAAWYFALTIYIEGVFPGEFGIPLPWYFPLSPKYWCGYGASDADKDVHAPPPPASTGNTFERPPPDAVAGVSLVNLRKVFGDKVAVVGSNLDMYKGHVTALLGHNGAGKTTTMSMITGLYPPTSGSAIVNGHNVTTDVKGAQRSLGICPQHDVLFDTLTVEEHLRFFCRLKGLPADAVQTEVDAMLASVRLTDKRNAQSKTLSGGQKRRLSCGMAFVGGSEVVILDEPTSGCDPAARRAIWELIKKYTGGRTILLSTHFLDEADVLSDRIAIMSDGVIKCCGTSQYLKKIYGVGYSLTMLVTPSSHPDDVLAFVCEHVPQAKVQSNIGAELSILLPRTAAKYFPALLTALDGALERLGVRSYGITQVTLEEVFLKVGEASHTDSSTVIDIQSSIKATSGGGGANGGQIYEDEDDGVDLPDASDIPGSDNVSQSSNDRTPLVPRGGGGSSSNGGTGTYGGAGRAGAGGGTNKLPRLTGWARKWQQMRAMIKKRMFNTRRNKWTAVAQMIPPTLFTLMALLFGAVAPPLQEQKARSLDNLGTNYGSGTSLYLAANDPSTVYNTTSAAVAKATGVSPSFVDASGPDYVAQFLIASANGTTERTYEFNRYTPAVVELTGVDTYKCWFNGQSYHSIAECVSITHGVILAAALEEAGRSGGDSTGFTSFNDPLPYTTAEKAEEISDADAGFGIAFSVLFGTSPLIASFIIFLVKERETKAKHVQFVSGVDAFSYWGCNYVYDFINYLIPIAGVFILFAAYKVDAYIGEQFPITLTIFVLYATSVLPLVYCASFWFQNPSIAFVVMTLFNIVTGLALMVTVLILATIEPDTANLLKNLFLVLPNFCFGQALSDLYTKNQQYTIWVKTGRSQAFCLINNGVCPDDNYWAWEEPGVGRYVVAMAIQTVVFCAFVILIERRAVEIIKSKLMSAIHSGPPPRDGTQDIDVDVATEAGRVRKAVAARKAAGGSDGESEDVVLLSDLRRTYRSGLFGAPKHAVNGISVGIPRNECFGLLGENGAGKTTTFKIMTGDESKTSGDAFIKGKNVDEEMVAIRQDIGYCPQYDALIDVMTCREILTMFAELRGIHGSRVPDEVDRLISLLMLEKHADKQSRSLSGGNKRKLSTAIALIGDPAIVFLDEPTTGMDAGARRFLWNTLLKVLEQHRSIILTSHSMEECEALCTRLAIMVNGQFKCIGSPQHLKSRFGQGYTLIARVHDMRTDTSSIRHYIESSFERVHLKEDHLGLVRYEVLGTSLATIFAAMEAAPPELNLDDYSVTQATLEQVFLDFATKGQIASANVAAVSHA